jgi:CRP-like cAMP-binding protein
MEMETESPQVLAKFQRNEFVDALRRNVLFQELTDEQLLRIFALTCEERFETGSFIIHQGELGTELFIIQTGSVEVIKSARLGGTQHQLAVLRAGDSFGELALVDNGFRSASVRALQPTTVLVLTGVALESLLHESDIIALIYKGLSFQLSGRLRYVNEIATAALEQETRQFKLQKALAVGIIAVVVCIGAYAYYLGAKSVPNNVNPEPHPAVATAPAQPASDVAQMPPVPRGF